MEEMQLPVSYKNRELEFPVKIAVFGYTHRFIVLIDGIEVTFEKDDQGEFRALMSTADIESKKLPEPGLLQAIAEVLANL